MRHHPIAHRGLQVHTTTSVIAAEQRAIDAGPHTECTLTVKAPVARRMYPGF